MKSPWFLPLAVVCVFAAGVVSKVGGTHGQGRAGAAPQAPSAPMPSAPAPVLTPEDGLKSLEIAPGYKVEIAAAEPVSQTPLRPTASVRNPHTRMVGPNIVPKPPTRRPTFPSSI